MPIIVFEDRHVADLAPITLGRPAYAVLCGSFRLVDLIVQLDSAPMSIVRDHLVALQAAEHPFLQAPDADAFATAPTLWVNARLVPSCRALGILQSLQERGEPGVVRHGSAIAAAVHPGPICLPPHDLKVTTLDSYFAELGFDSFPTLDQPLPLLDHPHEVVRYNRDILADNLAFRLAHGGYQEIADGVFAAGPVTLGPHTVTDTDPGPILLEQDTNIGPFSLLRGPVHLGPRTRVTEHTAIKDYVSVGHTAKIGGEVEASVIESFTNKQHHGFLGHSYLGSWINLGAGTCNSDLKNTYGEVNIVYQGQRVPTGMQFIGCVMGDYTKTAINTGIFTGKVIGACSMLYGFVTTNVPSFVNFARLFGQVTELPPHVMVSTQKRMFARRNVTQRPCDIQLIHDMYRLTEDERRLSGDPLAF